MLFGFASSCLMAEARASSFVAKALDLRKAKLMNYPGYQISTG